MLYHELHGEPNRFLEFTLRFHEIFNRYEKLKYLAHPVILEYFNIKD